MLALLGVCQAYAVPVIQHEPVRVAEKSQPLGLRVTVRDATARIASVAVFHTSSRGMTPLRTPMTSTGAGAWYGTIPGHLIGPGNELLYYIQAENADGETADTDWLTISLKDAAVAPAAIPSASAVAEQSRRDTLPASEARPAPAQTPQEPKKESRFRRYLVPAAIVAGGAVVAGGAIALANSGGGSSNDSSSGDPSDDEAFDGTYTGSYTLTFTPGGDTGDSPVTESKLLSVYITGDKVEIIGLWGSETILATRNNRTFSTSRNVSQTGTFPSAMLVVSGELNGRRCTIRVEGYSTAADQPGAISGTASTTRN